MSDVWGWVRYRINTRIDWAIDWWLRYNYDRADHDDWQR